MSTGPKTTEGIERIRRARTIHGRYSAGPGPGPDIDFGFNEGTILVIYVSVGEEQETPGARQRLSTGSPSAAEGIEHMRQDLDMDPAGAIDLKRADHETENRAKEGGKAF